MCYVGVVAYSTQLAQVSSKYSTKISLLHTNLFIKL